MARRAEPLELRFERTVDRSGEHHMWLGRLNPSRGTGVIKVNKVDVRASIKPSANHSCVYGVDPVSYSLGATRVMQLVMTTSPVR
jgi:hypothetical protein